MVTLFVGNCHGEEQLTDVIQRCPAWMEECFWDHLVATIARDSIPCRVSKFARGYFCNDDAQEVFMFDAVLGGEFQWMIIK